MFQIFILIALGVVAYSVTSGKLPALPAPVSSERVWVDGDFLLIQASTSETQRIFPLDDLDYMAIRTRSGDRPYRLVLEFDGQRLEFSEQQSGVERIVDHFLHSPPEGTDFTRFGEAMEARRKALFVFLDRRNPLN